MYLWKLLKPNPPPRSPQLIHKPIMQYNTFELKTFACYNFNGHVLRDDCSAIYPLREIRDVIITIDRPSSVNDDIHPDYEYMTLRRAFWFFDVDMNKVIGLGSDYENIKSFSRKTLIEVAKREYDDLVTKFIEEVQPFYKDVDFSPLYLDFISSKTKSAAKIS